MSTKTKTLNIVRWVARILGTIAIVILLFGMFSDENSFNNTTEIFVFVCFPVCTVLGLLIAYKWEAIGGIIAIVGMIGLHILRNDLITNLEINAFAIPGLLYIIYAVWSRN